MYKISMGYGVSRNRIEAAVKNIKELFFLPLTIIKFFIFIVSLLISGHLGVYKFLIPFTKYLLGTLLFPIMTFFNIYTFSEIQLGSSKEKS